jgi:hypothetical protein
MVAGLEEVAKGQSVMDESTAEPNNPKRDAQDDETPPPGVNIRGKGTNVDGDIVGRDKIIYYTNPPALLPPQVKGAQELLAEAEKLLSSSNEVCSVASLEELRDQVRKFSAHLTEFGELQADPPNLPDTDSGFSRWVQFERSKVQDAIDNLKKQLR